MRHLIVGAGPVGTAAAVRLAGSGEDVTVVTRSGSGPVLEGVRRVALDAADRRALEQEAEGVDVLYNCANPPSYDAWTRVWPPLSASILQAARAAGAVLVITGNLYPYGPPAGAMTEEHPLAATGAKGRLRAEMWEEAEAAQATGGLRVTEARASDYYGPGVTGTAHLGERVVPRVLEGRKVRVVGDPDAPHSWTFVDDIARTLVVLGADQRAWGRPWHVPTSPPRSARQVVEAMATAAGRGAPKVVGTPGWALRAGGVASPLLRELHEVSYQFERPFVMDSSAVTKAFGLEPTPFDQAVAHTVSWWQSRDRRAG